MRATLSTLLAFLLVACSPPATFSLTADEPISGGTLTLNGSSMPLIKNGDGTYRAEWKGGEADGQIEIAYPDGLASSCRIGYTTRGLMTKIEAKRRKCQLISQTVI